MKVSPPSMFKMLGKMFVTGIAVISASAAFAGSASYTYDNLGRLTKVTYSNGVVITYTYDAAGNRTSVVTSGAAG
jgi:YD repeat-containing protein